MNTSCLQAMDGRIMHCIIISSCQSAATSDIAKCFWSRVWPCMLHYSKCFTFQ